MARGLRFSNFAPAVKINGQWFGCVQRTISGTGCTVYTNRRTGGRNGWLWLPCTQAEANALILEYGKPSLVIDGPVYVDGAPTLGPTGGIENTGGYLGSVAQRISFGHAAFHYSDEHPEGYWDVEPETESVEFDALGVYRASYSGGLRLSGLIVPEIYVGTDIPNLVTRQKTYLDGPWPLKTILKETHFSGDDGPFFSGPGSGYPVVGQFVSSVHSYPPTSASGRYQTTMISWIGNSNGVYFQFDT